MAGEAAPLTAAYTAQLEKLMDLLACPACGGELRLQDAQLTCGACSRVYPVVDGIPILIATEK